MYLSACFRETGSSAGMASRVFFTAIWDFVVNQFSNILNVLRGVADVFLGWFGTSWNKSGQASKTSLLASGTASVLRFSLSLIFSQVSGMQSPRSLQR